MIIKKSVKIGLILGLISIMIILCSSIAFSVLTDNLISYYSLDVNGDDNHTGGLDGTIYGTGAITTGNGGIIDEGLDFDGNNDYFSPPFLTGEIDGSFSLSFWFKADSFGTYAYMFEEWSSNNENVIMYITGGEFCYNSGDGNGGSNTLQCEGSITPGTWYHIVFVRNGLNHKLYINNVLESNYNGTYGGGECTHTARFGISYDDGADYNGVMDEIGFWTSALDVDDVNNLYNNGTGLAYPLTVSGTPELNVLLFNNTDYNITVDEQQLFFIEANYTSSGEPILNATCNYTSNDIAEIEFVNGFNYTIYGGINKGINYTNNALNVVNDAIQFQVCRNSAIRQPVQIKVNGSLIKEINKNIIPLCPSTHEELFITNSLINFTDLNYTVSCDSCTQNNNMTLVSFESLGQHITLEVGRLFSLHIGEDMFYNETTQTYQDFKYHGFPQQGSRNITIQCNDDIELRTYYIGNITPNAELKFIEDVISEKEFINATIVESGNISIFGECSGEIINFSYINVTYENGSEIINNDTEFIFIDSDLLNKDGVYNVSLTCIDDEGDTSIDKKYFILNDTVPPLSSWIHPLSNNLSTITQNESLNIDLTVIDVNLFDFNITCNDSLGVVKHQFYSDSITSPFQYVNTSDIYTNLGNGSCLMVTKDRHTKNDLKDVDLKPMIDKDNQELTFLYDKVLLNITLEEKYDYFKVNKIKDRYTFEPIYNSKNPSELTYYVSCNDKLYYWDDEEINEDKNKYGHYFGCGDFWLDFNIDGVEYSKYKVTETFNNTYRIKIKIDDKNLKLKTKSVGIKNTLTEIVSFEVVEAVTISDFDYSTSYILFIIMLVFVWLILLIFGILSQIPLLSIVSTIYGTLLWFGLLLIFKSNLTTPLRIVFISLIIINAVLGIIIMFNSKD